MNNLWKNETSYSNFIMRHTYIYIYIYIYDFVMISETLLLCCLCNVLGNVIYLKHLCSKALDVSMMKRD